MHRSRSTGTNSYLGVPIPAGDKAIGVIAIGTGDRHAYGEEHERLLSTLATNMGVALDNARLFEETKRLLEEADARAAELETVNRIGNALASQLDLDSLIELVGEQMRSVFRADIVYVALLDEATRTIEFPYYSEAGRREPQEPLQLGEGLTSHILQSREPLVLNSDEQFDQIGTRGIGTQAKSWLGVPILAGDEAIGVISVQSSTEAGRFGDDDARLLATLAASVGVAIQNARLVRARQESEERYRLLVEELPLAIYTDLPDADVDVDLREPRAPRRCSATRRVVDGARGSSTPSFIPTTAIASSTPSTRTSMGRPSGRRTSIGSSTPTAARSGCATTAGSSAMPTEPAVHPGVHDRHHRSDARGSGDPPPEAVLRVARRDQSGGHRDDGSRREGVGLEPCRDPALRVPAGRGHRAPHRRAPVRAKRAGPGSGDAHELPTRRAARTSSAGGGARTARASTSRSSSSR